MQQKYQLALQGQEVATQERFRMKCKEEERKDEVWNTVCSME